MIEHFYADAEKVTAEQIAATIRQELASSQFSQADALRTAVMYMPLTLTVSEWLAGAALADIHLGSARNRFNEVRAWQKEIGEVP
jgi:hypothetical protein